MFRSHTDTVRTKYKVNKESLKKYYCDVCPVGSERRIWLSESDLEIHRRRAHKQHLIELLKEPDNFMCTVCLRAQPDKPALIAHIKTNHLYTPATSTIIKREIFICNYCRNIFFNKLLLITHIKFYHLCNMAERQNHKAVCPYCNKNVVMKSMWFHYLYHGILRYGTCPICINTFEDSKEVLEHVESHNGYFSCSLCQYDTKKGDLFSKHMERHKKIVDVTGKNVDKVSKYYVPLKRVSARNKVVLNVFKGIMLAPEVKICVLCRTMCETDEEMLQHIYGDHSPDSVDEIKRHLCVCGEEFFNRVLLKHHIFTLKGQHKVYDGTFIQQENETQNDESEIIQINDDIDRTFGIVIEIKENTDSDDHIQINVETQDETDYKIRSDEDIQSQNEIDDENKLEIDICEIDKEYESKLLMASDEKTDLDEKNIISEDDKTKIEITLKQNENEIVETRNDVETEIQNDIETVDLTQNINDSTQNQPKNNLIIKDIDKYNIDVRTLIVTGKRKSKNYDKIAKHFAKATVYSNTPVYEIFDVQKTDNKTEKIANMQTKNSIEIIEDIKIIKSDNIIKNNDKSNVIILNNLTQSNWQNSGVQNLNNILNKMPHNYSYSSEQEFESDRKNVNDNFCDSTVPLLKNINCIPESSQETTVYEVLEVPAESSEESGKIIIEDNFI